MSPITILTQLGQHFGPKGILLPAFSSAGRPRHKPRGQLFLLGFYTGQAAGRPIVQRGHSGPEYQIQIKSSRGAEPMKVLHTRQMFCIVQGIMNLHWLLEWQRICLCRENPAPFCSQNKGSRESRRRDCHHVDLFVQELAAI